MMKCNIKKIYFTDRSNVKYSTRTCIFQTLDRHFVDNIQLHTHIPFATLVHKYVVADRPPTGCGWNAHPVVFGPLNDFPAALFYKFMQRLNRVLNADNFGQLDKDGPQQLISDGDQSGDAAWEDDGTGGQVSPSSSTNEEGLVEEASTFVLGTVSDEQKVHYRAHTHSTRTHTHCRTHTHTRIYTLTLQ
jgi:hypothetical protein